MQLGGPIVMPPTPAPLVLSVPLTVGDTGDLLRGAAEEEKGKGHEQAEQHAQDAHGTALLQGHLEPLQDGTTHHDAHHRPRDVHGTWEKTGPWCPSSEPSQSQRVYCGISIFSASLIWRGLRVLQKDCWSNAKVRKQLCKDSWFLQQTGSVSVHGGDGGASVKLWLIQQM